MKSFLYVKIVTALIVYVIPFRLSYPFYKISILLTRSIKRTDLAKNKNRSINSNSLDSVFAAISAFSSFFPLARDFSETISKSLLKSTYDVSFVFKPNDIYIQRPVLEQSILDIYNTPDTISRGDYSIIVGPKGVGKSTLVARVLYGKEGVINLIVTEGDTEDSILSKVYTKFNLDIKKRAKLTFDSFASALRTATKKRNGIPLTIVFEVDRGSSSPQILNLVKFLSKQLAIAANVIIILSEANVGLGFDDDPRQNIIWVDDMEELEAINYIEKINPLISITDITKFIKKVGTRPLIIRKFAESIQRGVKVDDFIDQTIFKAKLDLIAFIHYPILMELKKKPNGVFVGELNGIKHKGILLTDPNAVAIAMKVRNAIVYHFPSGEYRPYFIPHKVALTDYNAPESP